MAEQWESSDYVARAMSTRPVRIDGTNHTTCVTREALEGAAAQVRTAFIPITIEHLDYVPPIGRWHSAEVVKAPGGEYELELRGRSLRHLVPVGDDPVDVLLAVDDLPEAEAPTTAAKLRVEVRNFDAEDISDIRTDPPFPVQEEERWSSLPPLIWTLSIPVVWGACRFAGSFFRDPWQGVSGVLREMASRCLEPIEGARSGSDALPALRA